MRQPALRHEVEGAGELCLGLGRKPGDEIGAEDDVGTQVAQDRAEADRVAPGVAPLHPLEDEVITRLEREVDVRHQPRLLCESGDQLGIGFHRIDGGKAKAREIRHLGEDRADEAPEAQVGIEIAPIGREIDAREHHFAAAMLDDAAHLRHGFGDRDRA